jgi:superfamily II DNA or RNA helicase
MSAKSSAIRSLLTRRDLVVVPTKALKAQWESALIKDFEAYCTATNIPVPPPPHKPKKHPQHYTT